MDVDSFVVLRDSSTLPDTTEGAILIQLAHFSRNGFLPQRVAVRLVEGVGFAFMAWNANTKLVDRTVHVYVF
jgi:hypothetical protein